MNVLYFAKMRQLVGTGAEALELPMAISTPRELISWLCDKGENYRAAFADLSTVKVAINQEYASLDEMISSEDEIAFFPPVTGG